MTNESRLGAKLGPRVAQLISQAIVDRHLKLGPHYAKVGSAAAQDFYGVIGSELAASMRPMLRKLSDKENLPPELRQLYAFLAHGEGQAAGMVLKELTAGVGAPTIMALVNNLSGPAIGDLLQEVPLLVPDAGVFAQAAALGLISEDTAAYHLSRAGLSGQWSDLLVELNRSVPDVGTILELVRRGFVTEAGGLVELRRVGFQGADAANLLRLVDVELSVPDAALGVVRGTLTQAQGEAVAAANGLDADSFGVVLLNTGQPLGLQQLLEAYRRGIIGQDRLAHGIRQGDLRNEWLDVATALRYAPPSLGDVLAGAVTNNLSDRDARQKAQEAGLAPDNFDWLLHTHGRPPGAQEMLQLLRRGLVDEDQVAQAIRESDIKDKYIPAILQMKEHLLPERTVVSLHGKGAITDAVAKKLLTELGVSDENIGYLLAEGKATKLARVRDLSEGQVLELYGLEAITKEDATARLQAMGFDHTEAAEILHLQDLLRAKRLQDQAVAVVRAKYLQHKVDNSTASQSLDLLKVSAAHREQLLHFWDLERQVTTRELTPAQIIAAAKHQHIDYANALTRLLGLGYDSDDAQLLLAIANVTPGSTP